ncbi:MAG: hypothetical protein U0270_40920 [Labilithrix sp.]
MKSIFALAVLATMASAVLVTGCDSAERRDAQVVIDAIRRFRQAQAEDIPPLVEALKATECKFEDSCRAKTACLKTGEPTAKAIKLKSNAERVLHGIDSGKLETDSAEALTVLKGLDDASALLKEGQAAIPACDEAVDALKRKYSAY